MGVEMKCTLIASALFVLLFSGCKNNPVAPTSPVVSIVSPTSSEVVGDSALIQISATDDKGITKVEIYIDNQIPQGGTLLIAPYIFVWNTGVLKDSSAHLLYAKAYDADGNVTSTPVMTLVAYRLGPTQLQVAFPSDTLASLSWVNNSSKETGFEIERSINGASDELVQTVGANITNAVVPGVYLVGNNISFRVRAVSGNIESKYSNTITIQFTFPAPSNLRVTSMTETLVQLQWQNTNSMATQICIERSVQALTGFILVDSIATTSTTKTVMGAYSFDTTYYFRIYSKSALNRSAPTTSDTALIPFPAPSNFNLEAKNNDFSNVYITWTDTSSFVIGFVITFQSSGQTGNGIITLGAGVNSYEKKLGTGTTCFRMQAITATRQSEYTNQLCAYYSGN
jgi:hypothetical protein